MPPDVLYDFVQAALLDEPVHYAGSAVVTKLLQFVEYLQISEICLKGAISGVLDVIDATKEG